MDPNNMDHTWSIHSRIAGLRKSNILADVQFIVGDMKKSFHCHKLILAVGSEAFQAMFYGSIPASDPVILPDVTHEAFSIMLEYLYNDKFQLRSCLEAFETAYLAKKYLIKELFLHSESYLLQNFHRDYTVICTYLDKAMFLEMRSLTRRCKQYIARKFLDIVHTQDFLDISKPSLEEILKLNTLNVTSESEVACALLDWGSFQCAQSNLKNTRENMRTVLGNLLEFIRFPTLTVVELHELVKKFTFLQTSENLSILLKIALPSNDSSFLELPKGIGSSSRRRTGTRYSGLDIPVEYRYNGDGSFYVPRQEQTATIKATGGEAAIIGVICIMRGIAGYLKEDRHLNVEISLKNCATKFEFTSVSKISFPPTPGLEDHEFEGEDDFSEKIIFEDPFFFSENELLHLRILLHGEGLFMPQLRQQNVTAVMGETKIEFQLGECSGRYKQFLIQKILFM